ncbi:hydrogenase maturation protease [Actinomadura viridis]|uniref:Hydrogenase maturation protease n=1 Tax=Actinomadura viridis TaxID=58110 RepID=A0A931DK31_9ACTN|nr:hydrogenase maturation protease [Actinomadura viridis]MBG6089547.1 hydrogenase maturation protease [Actinomadura viridis]
MNAANEGARPCRGRVLVAGIGNVFLGDDGFGVEVVNRVDTAVLPPGVDVVDYGIRGLHLAYGLLDGRHDTLIMVDAVPLDGPPGSLAVLEVDDPSAEPAAPAGSEEGGAGGPSGEAHVAVDGHGMDPQTVLRLLRQLGGGGVERVLVVGCRPAVVEERMGLSEPVRAAVDEAVGLVTALACAEAARPRGRAGTEAGTGTGAGEDPPAGTEDHGQADTEWASA